MPRCAHFNIYPSHTTGNAVVGFFFNLLFFFLSECVVSSCAKYLKQPWQFVDT